MSASDLRVEFWAGLAVRLKHRPDWALGRFRILPAHPGYIEFEERLGLGFRPRAVFLTRANELRAEILTQGSADGLDLLDRVLARQARIATLNQSIAEASVSGKRSDGKVQIVWPSGMTRNRQLWQLHCDWIGETLSDLRETIRLLIASNNGLP
ncbi:MAG: hypothetical protein JNN02_05350 [Tabrizicola sp.]|nr:hypothetical protein [Tabrizicola sp.]